MARLPSHLRRGVRHRPAGVRVRSARHPRPRRTVPGTRRSLCARAPRNHPSTGRALGAGSDRRRAARGPRPAGDGPPQAGNRARHGVSGVLHGGSRVLLGVDRALHAVSHARPGVGRPREGEGVGCASDAAVFARKRDLRQGTCRSCQVPRRPFLGTRDPCRATDGPGKATQRRLPFPRDPGKAPDHAMPDAAGGENAPALAGNAARHEENPPERSRMGAPSKGCFGMPGGTQGLQR